EVHHAQVAAPLEVAVHVQHERDAARHPRREVPAGAAEHDDAPARHVLTAVVADALDDRVGAAVSHAEPLAGDATHIGLAAGGPSRPHGLVTWEPSSVPTVRWTWWMGRESSTDFRCSMASAHAGIIVVWSSDFSSA